MGKEKAKTTNNKEFTLTTMIGIRKKDKNKPRLFMLLIFSEILDGESE